MRELYHIGLDIGSTTIKAVVTDDKPEKLFTYYSRHNADIQSSLTECLRRVGERLGEVRATLRITGSIGIGVAEKCGVPFVQEVVAAAKYVTRYCPDISTMIDIGGEDAKVVIFKGGKPVELRMNGNCAGGTGAFIDQMAILMGTDIASLNEMALGAEHIYPIASRCGVFCKTDVQNLLAKNAARADIARSIFHAVAVQTVTTLAHGQEIAAPLLFVGGPLTFIPALRKAFADFLHMTDDDFVLPDDGQAIPAFGAALHEDRGCGCGCCDTKTITEWIDYISRQLASSKITVTGRLQPLFGDDSQYQSWKSGKGQYKIPAARWNDGGEQRVALGIDSGSTTTKIVALDADSGHLLYSFYSPNLGNSVATVEKGLGALMEECRAHRTTLQVAASCSTGYGEDLVRAAFGLSDGIVETMAHYMAARHINPDVSFILDIGGQDMKAIFVSDGVINRMEINEACSSGCGSFIETFAKSLNYSLPDFVKAAVEAQAPCDLGTRCTVFMNSKVKQVLREGASVADLAAGLAYSVVKNCLYKVLKMKDTAALGDNIVLQGGTMRNHSIIRAFELLTGKTAFCSDKPELMGAYGCALYASRRLRAQAVPLAQMIQSATYKESKMQCRGCENNCLVSRYTFGNGNRYFSGNRCERVFTNHGKDVVPGHNAYADKTRLLFDRKAPAVEGAVTIGIPRALNMFEEYPFWHTLFTRCGFNVVLSDVSRLNRYEATAKFVMADNICFPAKLVHSHVQNLAEKGVDRIFMPFVVHEASDCGQNSFNCPIVTGYSQVVKSVQPIKVPLDSPVITFKDTKSLAKQCADYLKTLGVDHKTIKSAISEAMKEQEMFQQNIALVNNQILMEAASGHELTIMLAGRPYHADPLIQHKLADIVAAMGVNVLTDDLVRGMQVDFSDTHLVAQWAYPNRIMKAAKWAAESGHNVQFMQITSFGCGPDAFIIDEVRNLLHRYGKALTLLKVDDVTNIGSLKLRVRSAIESIKFNLAPTDIRTTDPFVTTPVFTKDQKWKKIIAPFFTPFISPLIPDVLQLAGYDVDILPISDNASAEWGLSFANNEVCYPATLVVGDIIKALKQGNYAPDDVAVAITQTGGQCRASNYISLIKRALVDAGFTSVPVVSLSFGGNLGNEQPGFNFPWLKLMPIITGTLLYSDALAKLYYATVVRESVPGRSKELLDSYLNKGKAAIRHNSTEELNDLLAEAVADFTAICQRKDCPRTGIVGEIFLKFHAFAQKDLTNWLISQGIEVAPPLLTNFFLQSFVNYDVKKRNGIVRSHMPNFIIRRLYAILWKKICQTNAICAQFPYFAPFTDIYHEAEKAEKVINMQAQFGEGWLLPAEVISFYESGIKNVVSLQPFGCIANQIVSRGVEHRIKRLCPDINILSLDFDSGVSAVNITNRLLLFTADMQ